MVQWAEVGMEACYKCEFRDKKIVFLKQKMSTKSNFELKNESKIDFLTHKGRATIATPL
jgi:hypothetical protein